MVKPLWQPSERRIRDSLMYGFMQNVNHTYGTHFADYDALYQWSVENIPDFWAEMWRFAGIIASQGYDKVIDDVAKMPGARWFPDAKLNYAENLLAGAPDAALAFWGEDKVKRHWSKAELTAEVSRLQQALLSRQLRLRRHRSQKKRSQKKKKIIPAAV